MLSKSAYIWPSNYQAACQYLPRSKELHHLDIFLEGTLKDFSRINKLFELSNADVVSLGSDFLDFFHSLLHCIVIPSRLEKVRRQDLLSYDFQNNLMSASCAHLGYVFVSNAIQLKIPKNDLDEVKQRYLTFLAGAVTKYR